MTIRDFLVRGTAYAGYRLTRLSTRLQVAPLPFAGDGGAHSAERTLAGDREIEWTWTVAHVRSGPGRVLDFGSGNGLMALGASLAGNHVVAVDLLPEQYPFDPHQIEYLQGDFNELELAQGSFDQILNCSSVEHVGLAGRYDSPNDPDGDLRAMAKMVDLLKPRGNMVLTIPVGVDAVHKPLHRIYGNQRLPRLLDGWDVQKESYWAKPNSARFEPVTREQALSEQGSETYYALGLYVIAPR